LWIEDSPNDSGRAQEKGMFNQDAGRFGGPPLPPPYAGRDPEDDPINPPFLNWEGLPEVPLILPVVIIPYFPSFFKENHVFSQQLF